MNVCFAVFSDVRLAKQILHAKHASKVSDFNKTNNACAMAIASLIKTQRNASCVHPTLMDVPNVLTTRPAQCAMPRRIVKWNQPLKENVCASLSIQKTLRSSAHCVRHLDVWTARLITSAPVVTKTQDLTQLWQMESVNVLLRNS